MRVKHMIDGYLITKIAKIPIKFLICNFPIVPFPEDGFFPLTLFQTSSNVSNVSWYAKYCCSSQLIKF